MSDVVHLVPRPARQWHKRPAPVIPGPGACCPVSPRQADAVCDRVRAAYARVPARPGLVRRGIRVLTDTVCGTLALVFSLLTLAASAAAAGCALVGATTERAALRCLGRHHHTGHPAS